MGFKGHTKSILFLFIFFLLPSLYKCSHAAENLASKKYPEGFSLKHPQNWLVQVVDKLYILASSKPREGEPSFILVYPFFLKEKMSSETWIEKKLPGLTKFFKAISFEKKSQLRQVPDEAAAKFRFQRDAISYQGLALCSIYEGSGILYVMAAQAEAFEKKRNELLSMLESFRFEEPEKGSPQVSAKPKIEYLPWQDPIENAFSMEVPRGWAVSGGTYRRASVDLTKALLAVSPNQKMRIQYNDGNIPTFAVPSQTLAWSGFYEGSWYSPGYGVRMLVKRYTPGIYFLTEYLQANYRPQLANFEIVSQKERPDLVANFSRIYGQGMAAGSFTALHAGEAAFRFEQNTEPFVGYGLASTKLVQSAASGTWFVDLLLIYTCPKTEAETVNQIFDHMIQSFRMNLQWMASQQQLTANVSQIVTQTNQQISKIINDSYWTRQAAMDDVNRKFSNYILGVTDVVDPATGEKWKVEAGHNYYWRRDTTDVVVGTKVYERPNIDFSALKEY